MTRRLRVILVVLVVIVALAAGLLLIGDVDISPDARAWLEQERPKVSAQHNLHHALVGFQVGEGLDPAREGARLAQQFNSKLAAHLSRGVDVPLGLDSYWETPALSPTAGVDSLCDVVRERCLETFAQQAERVADLGEQNNVLLERYDGMATLSHYRSTMTPDVRTPIPRFSAVLDIHRLRLAMLCVAASAGQEDAFAALRRDLDFSRRMTEEADYLLVKMVGLALVRQNLMTVAELIDVVDPNAVAPIVPLSQAERSLRASFRTELALSANLSRQLHENPRALEKDVQMPRWLSPRLFKPNHAINLSFELLRDLADTSELSAPELAAAWERLEHRQPDDYLSWTDYIRNPVGTILFQIAVPSGGGMMARAHDVDGLITLVNLKLAVRKAAVSADDLPAFLQQTPHVDPYHHQPIRWDKERRLLSFRSLTGDEVSVNVPE